MDQAQNAHIATRFEAILSKYEAPISRYVYGMVGDLELARDLTQDTFLSAYTALGKTDITNLQAWLYRVATNHVFAYMRRKRLIAWIPLSRLSPSNSHLSQSEQGDSVVANMSVEAALSKLDPKDRACLLLSVAGFSNDDISQLLGCSNGAARTRLSRARETFRQIYHKDCED